MTTLEVGLDPADAAALLARQTAILEQIARGAPLADVLTGIAATLEDLVPDCSCSVLLLERDTGILRHGAAPSLPAEYSAQIDGLDRGQFGAAETRREPEMFVAALLGIDARFDRRRCGGKDHHCFVDLSTHHGHVARMIGNAVILFIGGLMFFIDDDESEIVKGGKQS